MSQFDNACKTKDELTSIPLYSQGGLEPIILPPKGKPALTNRFFCIAKSIASCFSREYQRGKGGYYSLLLPFDVLKKVRMVDIMCFPTQSVDVIKERIERAQLAR